MGVKYVDDFEFPAEAGFTGSSGTVRTVRPHTRRAFKKGGKVKRKHIYEDGGSVKGKHIYNEGGKTKKAVGGPVHARRGGGFNRAPLVGKK